MPSIVLLTVTVVIVALLTGEAFWGNDLRGERSHCFGDFRRSGFLGSGHG
jgi:hypothetical protein